MCICSFYTIIVGIAHGIFCSFYYHNIKTCWNCWYLYIVLEKLKVITEIDRTYSNTTKKEKITKSCHLNDTININKHLLKSIDNRNALLWIRK